MKYVINPHLFYSSHSLGDLNYHSCCSVLHIDDPHMYITRQYSLSVLQTIFPPECPHGTTKSPYPKQSLSAFTQSWYFWFFYRSDWDPYPPNQAQYLGATHRDFF